MITAVARRLVPVRYRRVIRDAVSFVASWGHTGSTVHCPICNGHFRHFLPAGLRNRANARCPRCGSLERHRLIWDYLAGRTALLGTQARVLHIAPERELSRHLRRIHGSSYTTGDLEPGRADRIVDVMQMDFPGESFDAVICNHVLEHVRDFRKALREIARVLAPSGIAILHVPLDRSLDVTYEDASITTADARLRAYGQTDHLRLFGRDFGMELQDAGLVSECIDPLTFSDLRHYHGYDDTPLYVGYKS